MANHASAIKRHRQNLKRRTRNRNAKATIRTSIKKTLALVAEGNKESALKEAQVATRLLDKAAIHGVMHKKTAARTISRLHQRISAA